MVTLSGAGNDKKANNEEAKPLLPPVGDAPKRSLKTARAENAVAEQQVAAGIAKLYQQYVKNPDIKDLDAKDLEFDAQGIATIIISKEKLANDDKLNYLKARFPNGLKNGITIQVFKEGYTQHPPIGYLVQQKVQSLCDAIAKDFPVLAEQADRAIKELQDEINNKVKKLFDDAKAEATAEINVGDKVEVKEDAEKPESSELVRPYPIESIEMDLKNWLKPMIAAITPNFKQYIPRAGVSKTTGRKTIISYGIVIPIEDVPALNAEQVRDHLDSASKIASTEGNYGNIYTLDRFDVKGGKYVIIIRKVLNY